MHKKRWVTVDVGCTQICVKMKPGETEASVKARIQDSIWGGGKVTVIGIYNTPWGKKENKSND